MYFVNQIKERFKDEPVAVFVDMDGVIADYEVQRPLDYSQKRPLYTNLKTIEQLSLLSNIELYTLSLCKKNYQILEKKKWLDKYAPFFKLENRFIISKEEHPSQSSKKLKYEFLKRFMTNHRQVKVVLIDDDNTILKYLNKNLEGIILYQDSSIIY